MGIIKAALHAAGGALADQWLEVIEAEGMSDTTVFTKGVTVRANDKRNNNKKGTADTVSNGSIIHVYPGQFMMLVDGGKVVDFTAEKGYDTLKGLIESDEGASHIGEVALIGKNSPTPNALRRIIPMLSELGYEFVTISTLLDEAG